MLIIEILISQKVLALDGGFGTVVQQYKLSKSYFILPILKTIPDNLVNNYNLLSLSRPDVCKETHYMFLEAGADIIETKIFNSTRISKLNYNTQHLISQIKTLLNKGMINIIEGCCGTTPSYIKQITIHKLRRNRKSC